MKKIKNFSQFSLITRQILNMTQEEMAAMLGFSDRREVIYYEKGERTPRKRVLNKYLQIFFQSRK